MGESGTLHAADPAVAVSIDPPAHPRYGGRGAAGAEGYRHGSIAATSGGWLIFPIRGDRWWCG